MDKKNRKNLMECIDREQMIKDAKGKLRWYALEASEEEFDEEEVDKLVTFLEKEEKELLARNVGSKKIIGFNRWGITAAVIIGVLGLTLASASMNSAQAWETGGFFNRLRRDKEGQTIITSPDGLGMDVEQPVYYYELEDVPEKYRKYLFVSEIINELEDWEMEVVVVEKSIALQKVSESWLVGGKPKMNVGVIIYEGAVRVVRDSFDEFVYQYSYEASNYKHDLFEKDSTDGEKEYSIFFYDGNKKYFVTGQLDVEMLKNLAIEYMNFVIK